MVTDISFYIDKGNYYYLSSSIALWHHFAISNDTSWWWISVVMITQEWHVVCIVDLAETSDSRSSLHYVASTSIDGRLSVYHIFAKGACTGDIIFVFVLALKLLAIRSRLVASDTYHWCLAGWRSSVLAIELIRIDALLACLSIDHAYVTQPLFIRWRVWLLLLLRCHLLDILCFFRWESIVIAQFLLHLLHIVTATRVNPLLLVSIIAVISHGHNVASSLLLHLLVELVEGTWLFERVGCWRHVKGWLLLYNCCERGRRWVVHYICGVLNGSWWWIWTAAATFRDTTLGNSAITSDRTIVLVVRFFISFYYNVIWRLLLLLSSATHIVETLVKFGISSILLLNMHVGIDNVIHVILTHALVYSIQMNVIAVLWPLVLGNLVVKCWCQVTRHKVVHCEMVARGRLGESCCWRNEQTCNGGPWTIFEYSICVFGILICHLYDLTTYCCELVGIW